MSDGVEKCEVVAQCSVENDQVFMIEIRNLPNGLNYKELKRLFNVKLALDTHEIKRIGKRRAVQCVYATFRSEEKRERALKLLDGFKWRGRKLAVKKANSMADSFVRKRAGDSEDAPVVKKMKRHENVPVSVRIKTAVTPLWNVPYEKQLNIKETVMQQVLLFLGRETGRVNQSFQALLESRKANFFECCPMAPVIASPCISGYRNKCEFTIGKHLDTNEKTVGFQFRSYEEGSVSVAEPDECPHISHSMLKVVKCFQAYIQASDKDVYNPETQEGYWRQLTVRTSRSGDMMIIIDMYSQNLSESELEKEKQELITYFESGTAASCGITVAYFQIFARNQSQPEKTNLIHLFGKKFIEEILLGNTFRISPNAFFYGNTDGAEALYSTVAEVVGKNETSAVLDICCGIGTIGIYLSKQVSKVVGIEMVQQAVEDAKVNAQVNGITNVEFVHGKAEDVIIDVISKLDNSEVIAVIDPPRGGLRCKVLSVIRCCEKIRRLVYVSSSARADMKNFIYLVQPSSRNFKGQPFYPVQAIPIDMFPHTPYCQLVLVFERSLENTELLPTEDDSVCSVKEQNELGPVSVENQDEQESTMKTTNDSNEKQIHVFDHKSLNKEKTVTKESDLNNSEHPEQCQNQALLSGTLCTELQKTADGVQKSEVVAQCSVDRDSYSYTNCERFTSEMFKIEIRNLPDRAGYGDLRKLLNVELALDTHKIRRVGRARSVKCVYATFKNEEKRERAVKLLDGYKWRERELAVEKVDPATDRYLKRRSAGDLEDAPAIKKIRHLDENFPVSVRIKNSVTPLWDVPYEEQLKIKESDMQQVLISLGTAIEKVNKSFQAILDESRKANSSQCCPMAPVIASPCVSGYINRCAFAVGKCADTNEKVVGFCLSGLKEGSASVGEPDECPHISHSMLKAVKCFQAYIQASDKDVYNPNTHEGYWRQLIVRTSRSGDMMIIVAMHPQNLTVSELKKEKQELINYFESGAAASCGITSAYFLIFERKQSQHEEENLIHIFGKKFIEEILLGNTFRISPNTFFQRNSDGAEVLYSTVGELIGEKKISAALDICCGAGTAAICLSKYTSKVVGIEMIQQSVEDAKVNAQINGITNVEFVHGKAEDVIRDVISKLDNSELTAVVEPLRGGLYRKVLKVIYGCKKIRRLVYMSCDVKADMKNFIDLCRPPSNNYRGQPFYPVQAIPIDLSPHTPYCQLIMIFERIDTNTLKK